MAMDGEARRPRERQPRAKVRSRACTHKLRLASNGWLMSALPQKADSLPQSRYVCFVPKADMPVQQNGRRFSQDVNRNSTSTKKLRARSSSLIFIYFSQLWHEHQPADPQAVQLSLPFGQDRRA